MKETLEGLDSSITDDQMQKWLEQESTAQFERGEALKIYDVTVHTGRFAVCTPSPTYINTNAVLVPSLPKTMTLLEELKPDASTPTTTSWLHMGLHLEERQ